MPGVVARHLDQEPRLPGGVDAKGIASSRIQSKPSNIFGEREEALLSVPVDPKLNKATPVQYIPVLIYPVLFGVLRG